MGFHCYNAMHEVHGLGEKRVGVLVITMTVCVGGLGFDNERYLFYTSYHFFFVREVGYSTAPVERPGRKAGFFSLRAPSQWNVHFRL